MDMPPSGWYPDPYGVPGLLRWWDGAGWSEHTHAEVTRAETASPAGADPTTVQPAVTSVQPAVYQPAVTRVQPAAVEPASVQPATVRPNTVQPTTVQPASIQSTTVQSTTVQPTTVQPGMQLSALRPPTGPRTTPQPALPAAMGARSGATMVVATGPGMGPGMGDAGDGTRVLVLDDNAWAAGVPAPQAGGHYRARRRRRILAVAGLAGGVAAALAVIAFVVSSLSQSPTPSANTTEVAGAAVSTPKPATPAASPTPSASPTASPAMATVTDSTSGLIFGQLPAPFGPGCPASLSGASFTWTAGESASAGQVNNGQTPWYGEACSGQLPAQYGYSGTADLQNVAGALVNTFNGTYYAALPHTMSTTVNEPTAISGHPAWEIQFLMTYTSPQGMAFTNELGAVVVADPQTGAAPAVFYVSIPGNLNEANVATLLSSLQLTAVAPPPSAPATTPAVPGGSGAPVPGTPSAGSTPPVAAAEPGQGSGDQDS